MAGPSNLLTLSELLNCTEVARDVAVASGNLLYLNLCVVEMELFSFFRSFFIEREKIGIFKERKRKKKMNRFSGQQSSRITIDSTNYKMENISSNISYLLPGLTT